MQVRNHQTWNNSVSFEGQQDDFCKWLTELPDSTLESHIEDNAALSEMLEEYCTRMLRSHFGPEAFEDAVMQALQAPPQPHPQSSDVTLPMVLGDQDDCLSTSWCFSV